MGRNSNFNELEYKGKVYVYTYEALRDDSDMVDEDGFNMDTEEAEFNVEIYNEKNKLLKELEWEADAILEITENDIIEIIKKYKL